MLDTLETGDIILFSGRCKVARMIQVLTLCKWSHIGMIIKDENYDTPLVYEATHNDRVPGLDIGKKVKGVQVVKLTDRLEGYKGDMAVMRLKAHITDWDYEMFQLFRKSSVGVPFEFNYFEAFLSMFKWVKNEGCFESRFCTEHIGGGYVALGLLDISYPIHKLTPADFARQRVKLVKGNLQEPQLIKRYKR